MQVNATDESVIREVQLNPVQPMPPSQPVKKNSEKTEQAGNAHLKSEQKKEAPPPAQNEMKEVIAELDKCFQLFNTRLSFSFSTDKKRTIIEVINCETGETIRKIPPENMVKTLNKMSSMLGILVDQQL